MGYFDDMNLPKINESRQKSNTNQTGLKLHLLKSIQAFEADNNYEFESYEVSNVLLEIIKETHESYLNSKFGPEFKIENNESN